VQRVLPTALAVAALFLAEDAWAGGAPALLLPVSVALAIVEQPARAGAPATPVSVASRWRGNAAGVPPPPPTFIPKRIHIPDLYKIDVDRDPPRFAEPVDNDRMVALEFISAAAWRPSVSFTYDTESAPIGDSSKRVSLRLELPF
jgi:hypothetical protein